MLPDVDPYPAAELAEAGRWIDEAVHAEIARARQPAAGDHEAQNIPQDDPPTMAAALDALAAESRRRIEEAEAALAAPSQHQARPAPRPTKHTAPGAARANAMAVVVPGSPACRPPGAGIRAAALASAANHLMTGAPTQSPRIRTPAR
jgi:hypothetical protein